LSGALAEVSALPRRVRLPKVHPREMLAVLAPTRRSLGIGCGIVVFALGGYALARETSLFAISRIDVSGGSPRLASQVRRALAPLSGASLVGLDGGDVVRRVDALPTVVRATYDRAFPHTLRITVVPERPGAVLRRGPDSWLVSVRGRVIERLPAHADAAFPRVWVSGHTPVSIGETLDAQGVGAAARAVGLAGAFASRIASASFADGSLVFHLRSGLELLLGDRAEIPLKVAVAERALALVPSGSSFLDVSVPGRAVSGTGTSAIHEPKSSSRG
jgi:cell division protein FtsQ